MAPVFERVSAALSRTNALTFVKIDTETQKEIASAYNVTTLPTFMVFRDGKMIEKVGNDARKLPEILKKLASEVKTMSSSGEGSGSAAWRGAELPRGYNDITDQVEVRGCELLNADDDCGTVRVLFDKAAPTTLKAKTSDGKDWVESGADDQLLLFTPFQAMLKLHTLQVGEE